MELIIPAVVIVLIMFIFTFFMFKNLVKRITSLKNKVMSFMKATNQKIVKANDVTISLVTKTNEYDMDVARFKIEHPELYAQYRKKADSYSYLKII